MGRLAAQLGLARSLCAYYGIPFRRRRLERLYAEFVSRGALCFDIGAHVGNRVRCWRALGARVVAVEPQRQAFRVLEALYARDSRVSLLRCAIGREPRTATLQVSDLHPTVASVSTDWIARVSTDPRFAAVRWNRSEPVEMRTLDALIADYGKPDFVKIDVEGYEADVLAGLSTNVAALSFEYIPAARKIAIACVDRLARLGEYRYNLSHGESHRLALEAWVGPSEINKIIDDLPARSGSGDIYARIVRGRD